MKFKISDAKNDQSLRVYENIKEPPGPALFLSFLPVVDGILNWKCIFQYGLKGAQWLSGRVLDSRPRVRASPASLSCVLKQEH